MEKKGPCAKIKDYKPSLIEKVLAFIFQVIPFILIALIAFDAK